MTAPLSRRRALTGAATLGVGAPLLAACGDDGASTAGDGTATDAPTSSAPTGSAPASAATSEATTGSGGAGAGQGLVATSDVPVGGGVILNADEIVVTQPAEGEFKAFSAICTHQGCLVSSVADGRIMCACHGSSFDITDGSVAGGPASAPLGEVAVSVRGGRVVES